MANPHIIEELDLTAPDEFRDLQTWLHRNFEIIQQVLMSSSDFYFDIADGQKEGLSGASIVSEAGNISTSIQTIWEEDVLYTYSSTADIDTVSSSAAGDTHAVEIVGLDADYAEITQLVTLTGQTPVTLPTALIRVNHMHNASASATQGIVYCWVSGNGETAGVPDTIADIRAEYNFISGISKERSASSVFTVPAGKKGFVVFGKTTVTDSKAVELTFWVREFGGVFKLAHHIDVKNNNYDYFFKLPGLFGEKSDVEVRASIDVGSGEASAVYDVILKDIVA